MNPVRNIMLSLLALIGIVLIGTLGYSYIEHWSYLDSVYMTVITLSTVGFREIQALSANGQIFTIMLIVCGTTLVAYAAGSLVQLMVEGQFRQILGRKKLLQQIAKLENHYIICGYGRIGNFICQEFIAKPVSFVVGQVQNVL